MTTELTTDVYTKKICVGREEIKITEDEFRKIDQFISKGKSGLIRLKNGEYVNLSFVHSIREIKEIKPEYL